MTNETKNEEIQSKKTNWSKCIQNRTIIGVTALLITILIQLTIIHHHTPVSTQNTNQNIFDLEKATETWFTETTQAFQTITDNSETPSQQTFNITGQLFIQLARQGHKYAQQLKPINKAHAEVGIQIEQIASIIEKTGKQFKSFQITQEEKLELCTQESKHLNNISLQLHNLFEPKK